MLPATVELAPVSAERADPPEPAARATPARRQSKWSDERICAELAVLLAGRTSLPTVAEFDAAGANLLYQAMRRHGGVERWAREFGLAPRRPGRALGARHRWSDECIHAALAALLTGRERWPAVAEFDAAGARQLYAAVRAHGGVERWARAFGFTPPARQPPWTAERIRLELAAFLAGREHWPVPSDFERAGKAALYTAACRHGGVARWAHELGYPYPPPRRPRHWTEERIRAELQDFLAGRAHWPTRPEFASAGNDGLWRALQRGRGLDWWAAEFGLARGRAARRQLDERATRDALAAFLAGRSRFPPRREFTQAGADDLWLAARRHGGVKRWIREFGVRSSIGRPARRRAASGDSS